MSKEGKGRECTYCGRTLHATYARGKLAATRDHVFPRAKAKNGSPGFLGHRLVWACRQCNSLKADKLPEEWSAFMKANPNWWTNPKFQHGNNVKEKPPKKPPVPLVLRGGFWIER